MRILCIAGKDVHNFALVNIIKEIKRRKHEVEVYAVYNDEIHNRMLNGIVYKDIELLTDELIEEFDLLISSYPITQDKRFRDIKKLMVVYSTSYTEEPYTYGDLTILQRDITKSLFGEDYSVEKINRMMLKAQIAIGNPKYDRLVENNKDGKNILFVDSGHYPFGSKGKREVAKTILKVAEKFPEYTIEIKPRFLPGDINTTHKNYDNVYLHLEEECGGRLPSNLYLHSKHCNLDDCIINAKTVITYFSTSYIDVAVAGKGLVILDGLSSEETVSHSAPKIKRFKKLQEQSSCLVPFERACEFLPEGLHCNERHLKDVVYQIDNVENSIVDVCEYLNYKFIKPNNFLGPCNSTIDNYRDTFIIDENGHWEKVIHDRYKSIFYSDIATKLYRINDKLDFSKGLDYIDNLDKNGILLTRNNFAEFYSEFQKIINKEIVNQKRFLSQSSLLQSYYIKALFELNKLDTVEESEILCKAYYWHLKGKSLYGKDNKLCIHYLKKHLEAVKDNLFERTLADEESKILSSMFYIGVSNYDLENYKEAREYFKRCQELTNSKHRKAKEYLARIEQR